MFGVPSYGLHPGPDLFEPHMFGGARPFMPPGAGSFYHQPGRQARPCGFPPPAAPFYDEDDEEQGVAERIVQHPVWGPIRCGSRC